VVKKVINSYKNTRIKTAIRTLNIAILLTIMSVALFAGMAAPAAAPPPSVLTLNVAIKYGADRLVETQNNDGTWEWSNPDTDPATTSYPGTNNILGVTAKGLVRAYLATGNLTYLEAAKKTADLLVSKTPDGFGPDDAGTTGKHKVYGQDITFLMEFADAWTQAGHDGSAYSAKADEYMVYILNNANRLCATGCSGHADQLVESQFAARTPNLYGWDIEGWVEAAVRTGHTTFASEVVSNMSSHYGSLSKTATGPLGGTGACYVLGLSGYLQSYILSGKTPAEYSAIKNQLLSELDTDGSFKIYAGTDDGIKQSAAYALMALNHTTTDMTGTVNYLVTSQSSGGIWIENDGKEYTEVDSEILTALSSFTVRVAIKNGADRLVETQNNDGTWEWSNPDTNPATTSYPGINNILGVTARGLVRAYLATGNVSYLDAAKKTADLLVSKTPDGFGPDDAGTTGKHKVYGQDITFLMEFADAWTIAGHAAEAATYSAKADAYMVYMLNNANRLCSTGCGNNASGLVISNFNTRQPNLYGWDIEGWVEAAVRTGHTTFASEVVSNMSSHLGSLSSSATGTLGGTGANYVLGLSGYLQSYILTGKTPAEYSAIKTQLMSELDTNGSFKIYAGTDDSIKQSAAYALMALNHTSTDMTGTVNYLVNSQSPGGIWIDNDGSEYPEAESEILTALVTTDNTKPVITLLGSSTVTVEAGSVYTDTGATALDNYDGVLTSSIVTAGLPVNTNVLGAHIVTYDVTDAHGNAATQVTRTVNVVAASTYSVSGYVSDNLAAALGGVLVHNGSNTATTSASGYYIISGLVNGKYYFNYSKAGFNTGYLDLTVSGANIENANKTLSTTILPETRYINGTVIDSGISHTPLAGVTVSTTGHSTVTDGSGKYSFAVVSGSYPLTASYDIRYYMNSSVTVSTAFDAVVNQDIVLQLKPTGTITGAVTVR